MAAISVPLAMKPKKVVTKGVLQFPDVKTDGLAAEIDFDDDKVTKMIAETVKKEGDKLLNKQVAERLKKIEAGVQKTEAIFLKKQQALSKANDALSSKRGKLVVLQKKGSAKPSVIEAFNKEVETLTAEAEKQRKELEDFKKTCQTMLDDVVKSIQFKELDGWIDKVIDDARKLAEKKAKKKIKKHQWKKAGKIIAIGMVAVVITAAAITVSVLTLGVGTAALAAVVVPAMITGLTTIKSFYDTGKKHAYNRKKAGEKISKDIDELGTIGASIEDKWVRMKGNKALAAKVKVDPVKLDTKTRRKMGVDKSKLASVKKQLDGHVNEMNQYHMLAWAELMKLEKKKEEIEKKVEELAGDPASKEKAKPLVKAMKAYDKALKEAIKVNREFEKFKDLQTQVDKALESHLKSQKTLEKAEWQDMAKSKKKGLPIFNENGYKVFEAVGKTGNVVAAACKGFSV